MRLITNEPASTERQHLINQMLQHMLANEPDVAKNWAVTVQEEISSYKEETLFFFVENFKRIFPEVTTLLEAKGMTSREWFKCYRALHCVEETEAGPQPWPIPEKLTTVLEHLLHLLKAQYGGILVPWAELEHEPIKQDIWLALILLREETIDQSDGYYRTPLERAVWWGFPALIERLLARGAQRDENFHQGTPLHHAVKAGNPVITEQLLRKRALVDVKDSANHATPLHLAAQNRSMLANVKQLLAYGANVNLKDAYGYVPLHEAARSYNLYAVIALLMHGADPMIINGNGLLPSQMGGSAGLSLQILKAAEKIFYTTQPQFESTSSSLNLNANSVEKGKQPTIFGGPAYQHEKVEKAEKSQEVTEPKNKRSKFSPPRSPGNWTYLGSE